MENSPQSEEQLVIIQEETFKPISEINNEYKKLNDDLITAMEIFERIFEFASIEKENIEDLRKLNLVFNNYKLNHQEYKIFGEDLSNNILIATLSPAYIKSMNFFNSSESFSWNSQFQKFKVMILEINMEIDFMLIYIEDLRSSLEKIFYQFNPHSYSSDNLDYDHYAYMSSVFLGFNDKFNFELIKNEANRIIRLTTRKEFYITAICDAKMFSIVIDLFGKEETDYQIFVQKCIEAIKVIEFEMIANHLPIDETIKLFDKNNTVLNQKIEEEINVYQPDINVQQSNPIQVEVAPIMLNPENRNPSTTEIKSVKTFPNYLLHIQNEKLAEGLRKQFSTGKGKKIRIMIEALKQISPAVFTLSIGDNNLLYNALKLYFNRDIGAYSGIFSSTFDTSKEKSSIDDAITKINHVLTTLTIQE